MPRAYVDGDRITVDTTWTDKELVKAIPGSRWDSNGKIWTLPLTWAACVQLRGQFGDNLQIDDSLVKWSWDTFHVRIEPSLNWRLKTEVSESWEIPGLYPFQQAGVHFMWTAGSGLLADEMGTGKTVQITKMMQAVGDALPALVICPNSVKFSAWANEINKWYPEATPYVIAGGAVQRKKILDTALKDPTAVVIVNYEAAWRLSRLAGFGSMRLSRCRDCDKVTGTPDLRPSSCEVHPRELNKFEFRTVIADEAHRIKDPKAKQTRAVWALGAAKSVTRRWLLTGTPIANDPSDLWSLLHFIAPLEFPTKSKFIDLYCLQAWNNFGGLDVVGINPLRRDEFFKILDPRFRRMPKALVLKQLPAKVRTYRTVEMSPKQKKAYNDLSTRLITRLDDGSVLVTPNNLSAQVRLLQLSSSYCTVDTGADPNDLSGWQVELCEPSPKLDELMVILEEMGDRPVVVAAEHRRLIELAAARLDKTKIKYGLITGAIDEWERKKNLEDFQSGKLRVLLFTLKTGGVGLTMTAADTIVFLQRSWSMIDNKQAEDRVHRIGSEIHESIQIIDIVTSDTVEETQIFRLRDKMLRLDEITRDKATIALAGGSVAELDELEQQILSSNLGVPI